MSVYTEVQAILDDYYEQASELTVLEAGCGSGSIIHLPDKAKIVGIDISQEELDQNEVVDEKIVGDIQEYELDPGRYGLVVCSDVLEHLPFPDKAIAQMQKAVSRDGYLLLTVPNVYSIKGLTTKFTPMAFHNWIYKRIYKDKFGTKGLYPFPTYLRKYISPNNIERVLGEHDFETVFSKIHESGVQRRFRKMVYFPDGLAKAIDWLCSIVSFGRLTLTGSDYVGLYRKKSNSLAS